MKVLPKSKVVLSRSNFQAVATSRQYTYPIDTLQKKGGKDTGPSPVEYFLSGIASCVAITLRMYADKMKWDLGEITVEVSEKTELTTKGIQKKLLETISFEKKPTEQQLALLKEVSNKCPVAQMVKTETIIIKTI
ncbi:OsmC family protein [Flavicella sediminum]|uniref:OsmC family protein n=1 Tax=Flavicella sediminum TaxID=2585141 RepID=UPI0011204020|nr:OsmC family protein [Flavicella sediminum]